MTIGKDKARVDSVLFIEPRESKPKKGANWVSKGGGLSMTWVNFEHGFDQAIDDLVLGCRQPEDCPGLA